MTRRPSGKKPSGPERPPRELPPGSTEASRLLIRFEQMEGRFDVVVDAVTQNRRQLEERIDQLRTESKSDAAVLTIAVRLNSEDIRKSTEEIRKNSEDIRRLSDRLDLMAERAQLVGLEQRVSVLEQRAGISP